MFGTIITLNIFRLGKPLINTFTNKDEKDNKTPVNHSEIRVANFMINLIKIKQNKISNIKIKAHW
ncbi:MAG: hypothetical protein ACI9Z4_000135 [Polaribacter sp.]|jgi:hypothetical protein